MKNTSIDQTSLDAFQAHLSRRNMSPHTLRAYLYAVRQFSLLYPAISHETLQLYKCYLIDRYQPQTINLRIRAINCYVQFLELPCTKLLTVKHPSKSYLEHVISMADYEYLKNCLIRDGKYMYYFAIRLMAATGVRVSELVTFQVTDIYRGYVNIYSKGNRFRRVYIPLNVRTACILWLRHCERTEGDLFLNRYGNRISDSGIRGQLKHFAGLYRLNASVMYPHSFRHFFAKTFIEQCGDIAMLSDILGHETIETTRVYLHRSSTEQQKIFNTIVDW